MPEKPDLAMLNELSVHGFCCDLHKPNAKILENKIFI
jgi:hypothetical protein